MKKHKKQRRFLKQSLAERQPLFQPALESAKRPELKIDETDQLKDETAPRDYVVPYLKQEGKSGHPVDLNLPSNDQQENNFQQTPPLGAYTPSLKKQPSFLKSEYVSPMGPRATEENEKETMNPSTTTDIISLRSHNVTNRQIREIVGRLQKESDHFLVFKRVGD